jgi:hypothetical protein
LLLCVEENRHLVVKKGGLDPLVRILDSPKKDNEAKRWVANIIGLLCMKDRTLPTTCASMLITVNVGTDAGLHVNV